MQHTSEHTTKKLLVYLEFKFNQYPAFYLEAVIRPLC